jgi:hypothetical protein
MIDCREAERLMEVLFVERDPAQLGPLHAHTANCARCRERYDRLFAVDAALAGQQHTLAPAERDLLRDKVLGLPPPKRSRRHWLRLSAALAAGAVAAVLVVLLVRSPGPEHPRGAQQELAARGGSTPEAQADLGIRALCLRGTEIRSLGTRPLPGERPVCTARDTLGLAYRNDSSKAHHLAVLVVGAGGRTAQVRSPGPLPPTAGEIPLESTVDLERIGTGLVRIYAAFSLTPLSRGALQRAARGSPAARLQAEGADQVVEIVVAIGE